jgi:hypothetical protein
VSPVGTALDVLDTWIRNIDRRGLYSLLQLPSELEPDGELRLGQAVTVPGAVRGLHVFTFEGHHGERLVGQVKLPGTKELFSSSGEVIGPDGKPLEGGLFYGEAVTLPVDGTYRISVFNYLGTDMQVTVWDEKDAPAEAKQFPNEQCITNLDGTSDCFSTSVNPGASIPSGTSTSCSPAPGGEKCAMATEKTVPRP